ncbi:hypothetical protein FRZ67_19200 [Panacibacter ginsenosidivorans]|uniref:Uncharacterized protein n=1 Tax=Panacibacter ginsenosidivorans TaxID=1813871 RepID=A0A5B8VEC9_9BACT|nr:hypothetical protein [Panacibacter ginsenosidivorans]QEC69331.1 hypothetical protein FRZ67_19200 [Panacibacter ginsenosidivorans]
MATKLSKTHYFVFACLFLGILGSFIQGEFWSARALAESTLIICALSYLASKYYAGTIIRKYQDFYYNPGKGRRFWDTVIIESSFHIIMPVALALLYACCLLMLLKYLPQSSYKTVANLVNPVIDFNKHYIKYPLTLLVTVLGILTLTRYLSVKKYKSFQKASKYIGMPFKVAATLSFFLMQDKGISNNLLEYHFNANPVVAQFTTFNAATQQDVARQKEIKTALNAYLDYVIERLNNNYQSKEESDTSQIVVHPDAVKLKALVEQFPQVRDAVIDHIKRDPVYLIGDNDKTFTKYHEAIWTYNEHEVKTSNFYETVSKKESSFFEDFLSVIADERTSIKKKPLGENAEIIQKLMGDFWSEFIPADKLTESIPLHKILKDKAIDLLNDKLMNGIYTLFTKRRVTKNDIQELNTYIDDVVTDDYKAALNSVKNKFTVLGDYYSELSKTAATDYFNTIEKTADRSVVTYEEGIIQQRAYLEKIKAEWNTESDVKKNVEALKRRYPDRTDEELEDYVKVVRDEQLQNLDDRIGEIDAALRQKENLKDYTFIRDRFSAGGIFLGRSITPYGYTSPCGGRFYPALRDCPNALLTGNLLTLELNNNKLVVKTSTGSFESESAVSPGLLLAAYNYVYAENTYPVLIDGFFDNKGNEIFAYNRNFTYDAALLHTLFKSDNFIFDVLDDSIADTDLRSRFRDAVTTFHAERKDVSLSRIFDDAYFITTTKSGHFDINTQLTFSVVANDGDNTSTRYREMSDLSATFNSNYEWLLNRYPYLNDLVKFASYQALFRALPQNKVDITDLILKNKN